MRMHQVEVDDEVFSLVKTNAEPLVDTFNSSLRRLLPLGIFTANGTSSVHKDRSFPVGTPEALRQILRVVQLVLDGSHSRKSATQFVAKELKVAPQTVIDKYGRQLNLSAPQFDKLLDEVNLLSLQKILKSKFPSHIDVIEEALRGQRAERP